MDDTAAPTFDVLGLSAEIVSAFVSNNSLPPSELPALLISVHAAVAGLANGASAAASPEGSDVEKATPVQIRKSITPNHLVSFLDGKPYKTLKRHLSTRGLDFAMYRARFGLPPDYPTVALNYSAARSTLAKNLGLGHGSSRAAGKTSAADAAATDKPKRMRPGKKTA